MRIEPRAHRRGLAAGIALAIASIVISIGAVTPADAVGCPNEAIRSEQGSAALALPDCRAYELVSPGGVPLVVTNGAVPFGARAATSGDAMAYLSYYPLANTDGSGFFFRSSRGADGWAVQPMSPRMMPGASPQVACEPELDYSDDLATNVLRLGREIKLELPEESFCGRPLEHLVPGEPAGFANLYHREGDIAPVLVNLTPFGVAPANAQFQDGSADLSRIVFGEEAALVAGASPGYNTYVWANGVVRLATVLPSGVPVRGDLAGAVRHRKAGPPGGQPVLEGGTFIGTAPFTNAVSRDGERLYFYSGNGLYLRLNAGRTPTASGECDELEREAACTLRVDASRGLGPSGGGVFQYASADGGRAFFTGESELAFPSSAEPGKPDLYEYDLATDEVIDLTVGSTEAANVRGFSGASEDGSFVYFVARGALTGSQANSQGAVAQPKQPNLYLVHNGQLTFIATLDPSADTSDWLENIVLGEVNVNGGNLSTRTSPNGRFFAFNSARSLTGAGGPAQTFLFDAATGQLSCASCPPGNGTPTGATTIPAPVTAGEGEAPGYLPRGLTDAGQLFFTSIQPLLPADSDGVADVYEYVAGGLRLLSDGARPGPSFFYDSGTGGGDVFFATSDPLVRADTDNMISLYDARVGGGFSEPPLPEPPCGGEGCRGPGSSPPAPDGAATGSFSGPGNPKPRSRKCGKGKVKRHGRCVKKEKHRRGKQHQRAGKRHERGRR